MNTKYGHHANNVTANDTHHGLAGNGLAGNGLAGNGLAGNGLAGNGVAGNGVAGNGAAPVTSALSRELDFPNEALTHAIIGAGIAVHRQLGPGLLEALYERAMCVELERREIPFRAQVPIPLTYCGAPIGDYYADLIVADRVIVELKSVGAIQNAHLAQILTYLTITKLRLGLIMNFNVPVLHRGVKRVIR